MAHESDDDFAFAGALLDEPAEQGNEPPQDPEDPAFDQAVALLAAQAPPARLGFPRQSAAAAAYSRKCREAQRANAKVALLETQLKELGNRTKPVGTTSISLDTKGTNHVCSGMRIFEREAHLAHAFARVAFLVACECQSLAPPSTAMINMRTSRVACALAGCTDSKSEP